MYSDKRITPSNGRTVDTLIVLLHDRGSDDGVMAALAQRWTGHLPRAVFALPQGYSPASGVGASAAWFDAATTIEAAAERLGRYVDALKVEYRLNNRQVVLVGFGDGMALAIAHALRQQEAYAAVVGFSGTILGFGDFGREVVSKPPVMLIHGELDEFVSPPAFLKNFNLLESAGVPTFTCFRPQLGHTIDPYGADAAMFFLQGAVAANLGSKLRKDVDRTPDEIAAATKLVIWDLDDTLWDGTLDDVGELRLNTFRADVIKRLNRSGIVSAICSKNEFDVARKALESFGLWDEFVFPRISFVPKGDALKSLIADMQLKPKNCVFIDDNVINLAEANAMLPDLHALDATLAETDVFLQKLVDAHSHVEKSRVAEYRSLQSRVTESEQFDGDRESFLATCDIHVCIAWRADVVDFAHRIEELINRTNQLNFLKTRVEPGKMLEFVSEPSRRQCLAVFAWDKFGYHGLVGFIGIDIETQTLVHMAFSCRIMHMGIENWLLLRALAMFPKLKSPVPLSVKPQNPAWLKEEVFTNPSVRKFILAEEKKTGASASSARIRIMANCHSGVWAHFSGLRDVVEIDNFPRSFIMSQVLSKAYLTDTFAPALVYQFGTDLYDDKWPEEARAQLEGGLYEQCVREFCEFTQARGHKMLVVGSPQGMSDEMLSPKLGITRSRLESFTAVWREMAGLYDCVELMDADAVVGCDGMIDFGHYTIEASQEIAKEIARWSERLPSSLFESAAAAA